MEEILSQAFSTGDIKIVIAALVVYIVITFQRGNTKKDRDTAHDDLDKRLSLVEHDVNFMKEQHSLFADKLDRILNELTNIKVELAKKEEKK